MSGSFANRLHAVLAVSLLFLLPVSAQNKSIRLRNEVISTSPSTKNAAASPAPANERSVSGLFLIQFNDRLQPAWQQELRAQKVELLRYVPDDAFVVRCDKVLLSSVRSLSYVRWMGEYRVDHKIHRNLRALPQAQLAGGAAAVSVLFSPRAIPAEIAEARRSLQDVQPESKSRFGAVLRGKIAPAQLEALAQSSAVLWIEPAPSIKLNDEVASKIVAGDAGPGRLATQALGYDGSGVTVAVADSGLDSGEADTMHPDLFGRVAAFFFYGDLTDASDEHSHGTHVAGIIGGDGVTGEMDELDALYGLGVAPGANIIAQRIFDGDGSYQPPPTFETLTRDAKRAGADIGSNSWGDDTQGRYDISAMEFDALVRDADELAPGDQPYILEFSAGNAGPGAQTIGSPAVAKNVIASGASQNDRLDFFIYADGRDAMADFSSRGPCEDGRVKPDVVAPGTWIASLRSEYANDDFAWAPISDNYMYQGGTSQSGPHVSGAAAVFVQYYRESHTNQTPSPALVKAALINSAVDMDDSVETGPTPNMDEGWGRIDLTELLFSTRVYRFVDQAVLLQMGQTNEQRVVIASTNEPLKITLAYTDVPGFPGAVLALVNDLDLEVVAPDGTRYRGNQFRDGESVPNAPVADNINNVEGIHLFVPQAGEYIVRVRAPNVVQDARRDTGAVDQDFALVISGDVPSPGVGFVFLDRRAYTVPGTINVRVIDSDLAGQPSVNVTIKSTTQSNGLSLLLREAGSSGSFTGSVATTVSPSANSLQIFHGDTIQAEYLDASAGAIRLATARADLLPPMITAVGTTNEFGGSVVIWQTDELANSVVRFSTNMSLNLLATNTVFSRSHTVRLEDLVPGQTYHFAVISEDEAGNCATNDNNGALFSFVAAGAPTVLLVDNYLNDDYGFGPDIPLSTYTATLDQLGIAYDVWDMAGGASSPTFNELRPYRVVIWRVSDNVFINNTLSPGEQTAVQQYVQGGGSFFMASMEQLSRLSGSFRSDLLQVPSFAEDVGAPAAVGVIGSPITSGMNLALDYSNYETEAYILFEVPADISDTMTLSTNATPILLDGFSGIVGLAYPKTGIDRPGRVVFFSFPLDAVSDFALAPNNRVTLMRNILNFLAPGEQGVGSIALDRTEYTLPSLVTIEVADSDLAGQGQATANIRSTTEPSGKVVTLAETARRGIFRGAIPLVLNNGPNPFAELRAANSDTIIASYFDASAGSSVTVTSRVETNPPIISGVVAAPDYVEASIRWNTDEPADALVQYGESPLLGRTAYVTALGTNHEVFLDGLRPDRTYYYQVASRDNAGNAAVDANGGAFYTFRTLLPLLPPWFDDLEQGSTNWQVFTADESEGGWEYGVPRNAPGATAHSGLYAWGSNLGGGPVGYVESFLISPPIDLSGGNTATLHFWQNYDFTELEGDLFHYGEVMLITNAAAAPIPLGDVFDLSFDWEPAEYDLTEHLGKLVYVVWHYVLFSFDNFPRAGWLVDDISVTVSNIVPGTIRITNNLWQARFNLTGPINRSGQGASLLLTNALPGQYRLTFGDVPFYSTPPPQTNVLASLATVVFQGNYTMTDAYNNGMADSWEQQFFNEVSPARTCLTDTDNDGFADCAEFISGTNPTLPNSKLQLATPVLLANGTLRLEWPSVAGRAYRVEGSSDAQTWTPLSGWLHATSGTTAFTLPAPGAGAPYLFRVEVRP